MAYLLSGNVLKKIKNSFEGNKSRERRATNSQIGERPVGNYFHLEYISD